MHASASPAREVWRCRDLGCRSVGTELWRPPAELAQVTGARMEAEGKTGHVASSFCFLFSLWSIAVVD
ncbi:hypothetical protein GQ55_7G301100 [Panicum hallii var. hallii]|uniref:Uncharacterized protein n=1 Tax=Panicum hallii var. hallii TaxID=1504633 RepID=A0A2T7D0N4_9POAL|nr:hypothetical protein GQ55_7G301100 [Panicum hallii var. hallii]